jgi:hypothetical protein
MTEEKQGKLGLLQTTCISYDNWFLQRNIGQRVVGFNSTTLHTGDFEMRAHVTLSVTRGPKCFITVIAGERTGAGVQTDMYLMKQKVENDYAHVYCLIVHDETQK